MVLSFACDGMVLWILPESSQAELPNGGGGMVLWILPESYLAGLP